MDRTELLRRLFLESNLLPRTVETIERGTRIVLADSSFLDIMDSGVVLIYVSRKISCDQVMEYRERIRDSLMQLGAMKAMAGIEILSDSCHLAILRKVDFKLNLEEADEIKLRKLWREYVRTIKIISILTQRTSLKSRF